MSKKGFTIAEILLTLALIGIVAALTMPYLINEFNKDKWTITYKRTFAETYNTLAKMALSEDCAKSLTCTRIFDGGQAVSTKEFGDKMVEAMAVAKNCGVSDDSCFSHEIRVGLSQGKNEKLIDTMKDSVTFVNNSDFKTGFYTFITNRGVSYALLSFGLECLNNTKTPEQEKIINQYLKAYVTEDCINNNCQMLSLCGFIIVDVNGLQRPNTWGRDVFGMWVTDKSVLGVYPFGGEGDLKFANKCYLSTDSEADSRGCAARLVKDGWKMKY